MARYFNATNKYLNCSTPCPTIPSTGTIALWLLFPTFRPDYGQRIPIYFNKAGNYEFGFIFWNDGKIYAGFYPNSEQRIIVAPASLSLFPGVYHLLLYDWISGGASHLYIDNVSAGSRNPTTIFTDPTAFNIGRSGYDPLAVIAWPSCWNKVLSSDERDALWAGDNPTTIGESPSTDLVWHYPIDGSSPETEYLGGPSLTVNNAPAAADDPPELLTPAGIGASKIQAYSVLSPPTGISISKANISAVLGPPIGISASKMMVYSVLAPPEGGLLTNPDMLGGFTKGMRGGF